MLDNELLQQVATDIAVLKQAILGNGVKGLRQRMDELEEWRESHPRICPMEAAPNPRKANILNVVFAIIGAVGVVGSLAVAMIK